MHFILFSEWAIVYFYYLQGNLRANKPLSRRWISKLSQGDLRSLIISYLYHTLLSLYKWSNVLDRITYYTLQQVKLVYAETLHLWLRRSKLEFSSSTMRSLWRNVEKRYITSKGLWYIQSYTYFYLGWLRRVPSHIVDNPLKGNSNRTSPEYCGSHCRSCRRWRCNSLVRKGEDESEYIRPEQLKEDSVEWRSSCGTLLYLITVCASIYPFYKDDE